MKLKVSFVVLSLMIGVFFVSCEDEIIGGNIEETLIKKLTKTWYAKESSKKFGKRIYKVEILQDSIYANRIIIKNFGNLGKNNFVKATVFENEDSLNINSQRIDDNPVSGSGKINDNVSRITLEYTINLGTDISFETEYQLDPVSKAFLPKEPVSQLPDFPGLKTINN